MLQNNLYLEDYFFRYIDEIPSDEDRHVYERPYLNAGPDRRPTIDWLYEIPVDGEPADVHASLTELMD